MIFGPMGLTPSTKSEESFPASDPPSWDPLHSGPPTDLEREPDDR